MANAVGKIVELHLEPEGLAGRLAAPASMLPQPGQYLMATLPGSASPAPTALFPAGLPEGDEIALAGPLPADWSVGSALTLRGPLGQGFRLPTGASRVALAALAPGAGRLLALAALALARGAAVALYVENPRQIPANLPADIEVLPLDQLGDAPAWANYLAADLPREWVPDLVQRLGGARPACAVEALLRVPMLCGGSGNCGVCAVFARGQWKHACSQGPVFALSDLEAL